MKRVFSRILLAFLVVMIVFGLTSVAAIAHDRRAVGKYQFVVGWLVEPAFEGQKNGVDLRVTDNTTGANVEGLEETLKVEITYVPTGVSRTFDLRTIFRDPGHYTVDLLLTESGYYRMRFFGTIDGLSVDETFNSRSGGGAYSDVAASADIQFPVKVAEVREVEAVARHVEEENHELEESAKKTSAMAMTGIGLGVLGVALGGVSLAIRKRN